MLSSAFMPRFGRQIALLGVREPGSKEAVSYTIVSGASKASRAVRIDRLMVTDCHLGHPVSLLTKWRSLEVYDCHLDRDGTVTDHYHAYAQQVLREADPRVPGRCVGYYHDSRVVTASVARIGFLLPALSREIAETRWFQQMLSHLYQGRLLALHEGRQLSLPLQHAGCLQQITDRPGFAPLIRALLIYGTQASESNMRAGKAMETVPEWLEQSVSTIHAQQQGLGF